LSALNEVTVNFVVGAIKDFQSASWIISPCGTQHNLAIIAPCCGNQRLVTFDSLAIRYPNVHPAMLLPMDAPIRFTRLPID
jgi:hypothetical protein